MLVKKKNPSWFPIENLELKVGETIDMTDPKQLIINGDAVGLADDGITEVSAYELYGVIVKDEAKAFQEYLQVQKAKAANDALQAEKKSLETELSETKKEDKPVEVKAEAKVEAKKN